MIAETFCPQSILVFLPKSIGTLFYGAKTKKVVKSTYDPGMVTLLLQTSFWKVTMLKRENTETNGHERKLSLGNILMGRCQAEEAN